METRASGRRSAVDLIVLAAILVSVACLALDVGVNVQAELTRLGWGR